jgi:hypothetical protein
MELAMPRQWRLLNKRGVLKGLVSGMELAVPRQ